MGSKTYLEKLDDLTEEIIYSIRDYVKKTTDVDLINEPSCIWLVLSDENDYNKEFKLKRVNFPMDYHDEFPQDMKYDLEECLEYKNKTRFNTLWDLLSDKCKEVMFDDGFELPLENYWD